MHRPALPILSALALAVACAALAGLAAAPARATTLGRMTMDIGRHRIAYRVTDAADAGSGWEARPEGRQLSILWQGPRATDLLLMELVVKDGRAVSGRIALPESRDGTLEAKMPRSLTLHLARVRTDGGWLKIRGRMSGTLYPARRNGKLLPEDGTRISARFDSWVPGITPAPPKPLGAKAAGKTATTRPGPLATGRAAQPPRLRPAPIAPRPRPRLSDATARAATAATAKAAAPHPAPPASQSERPRSSGAFQNTETSGSTVSAPHR
ncbi:hypothetical protein GCM10008024_40200 [Allgaiera indica]|uniref:Uncharacterized protein n=1 Tax=Allgaiera indica TaxID=765699 RepID=A0AAN5A304_9RHOB|nr:hypothetical protein [Allgaiera indica]GHE06300.1 hypothetical protein GCM10008024_40200 [Allgaiera indica]SDX64221.1 hypothetical protein SAMN05444006_12253 [Allgaiera indica]